MVESNGMVESDGPEEEFVMVKSDGPMDWLSGAEQETDGVCWTGNVSNQFPKIQQRPTRNK